MVFCVAFEQQEIGGHGFEEAEIPTDVGTDGNIDPCFPPRLIARGATKAAVQHDRCGVVSHCFEQCRALTDAVKNER